MAPDKVINHSSVTAQEGMPVRSLGISMRLTLPQRKNGNVLELSTLGQVAKCTCKPQSLENKCPRLKPSRKSQFEGTSSLEQGPSTWWCLEGHSRAIPGGQVCRYCAPRSWGRQLHPHHFLHPQIPLRLAYRLS